MQDILKVSKVLDGKNMLNVQCEFIEQYLNKYSLWEEISC